MKKASQCLVLIAMILIIPLKGRAREGWSVGAIGMGNFFLTDADPDLSIGPGGGLFFDYRFNQRWSIETDLFFSSHHGNGAYDGDDGMWLLGVPTVELKFYLRKQEANIEPYVLAGLGVYVLTEGSVDNHSGGAGLGGNVGVGSDFYVTEHLSLGIALKFRPIALIQGGGNSAGLINLGLNGNIAWHF